MEQPHYYHTTESDDMLYQQYLSGDQYAGDQLMLKYGDALIAYLDAFIHNTEDAEDLMLECFTVILVNKPRIREGNFRAYLFKVARNMAKRLWKARFRLSVFELDESIVSLENSPEDIAWKEERNNILEKCLNNISPQYREALYLVYELELSYEQAAKIMGCSRKKADNLISNGKKSLRRELEKENITSEDI